MNELSILVPCISSEKILPDFIDNLTNYLMSNPADVEVIVIMNESSDYLNVINNYIQKKYPWLKIIILQKNGKNNPIGTMIRFGLAFSSSRYAVLMSPYGEADLRIINKMLGIIRKGCQLVQVTRFLKRDDAVSVKPKFRIYQLVYRFLARSLLGLSSTDFTYGYKMFDRVFVQAIGLTQNTHAISPEINIKTLLAGGKIEYLASAVMPTLIGGKFKLYKDGPGYLWLIVRGLFHRLKIIKWF